MKNRIICLLMTAAFLACAVCASAEEFELEHGIRFGMTKDEVIEKIGTEPEPGGKDEFITYREAEAEGFKPSTVQYSFDGQGRLVSVYESLHTDQDAAKLEKEFNAKKKEMTKLYGKPLGNKKEKTDELVSESLKLAFTNQSLAKAGKAQTKMSYNEWKVETDRGIVKIDQYFTMAKYKTMNYKTQDHVICYTFFPKAE